MSPRNNDNLWYNHLALLTIVGSILGVGLGILVSELVLNASDTTLELIGYPGELFLRALKCLVIPLVASGIMCATARLGGIGTSSVAKWSIAYYCMTSLMAAGIGIAAFWAIRPGEKLDKTETLPSDDIPDADTASNNATVVDTLLDTGRSLVPDNIVSAFVYTNMLGIIVFFMMVGIHLSGPEGELVLQLTEAFYKTSIQILLKIMYFSPFGVLSLVANSVGTHANQLAELGESFGLFCVSYLLGCTVHTFVFYPLVYMIVVRRFPWAHYKGIVQVWTTAFGTSSSVGTLPTTTQCCKQLGITETTCDFVLPLGATINMDGAVIHYVTAALFMATLQGLALNFQRHMILVLVSCLISIGASPIPTPGMVNLFIVFEAIGVEITPTVSLLLALEWAIDKVDTMVNVTGDSFGAAFVDELAGTGSGDNALTEDGRTATTYDNEW